MTEEAQEWWGEGAGRGRSRRDWRARSWLSHPPPHLPLRGGKDRKASYLPPERSLLQNAQFRWVRRSGSIWSAPACMRQIRCFAGDP